MRGLASVEVAEPRSAVDESGMLLVAHRNGDSQAFGRLVQNYRRPVYGYLVRCGVPEGERDDLFQDVFVRVHQRARSFDPAQPLSPVALHRRGQRGADVFSPTPAPPVLLPERECAAR